MKVLKIFFLSFNLFFSMSFQLHAQVNLSGQNVVNQISTSPSDLTAQNLVQDISSQFENFGLRLNQQVSNFFINLDFSPRVDAVVDQNTCEISISESILGSGGVQRGEPSRCFGGVGTGPINLRSRWRNLVEPRKKSNKPNSIDAETS